MVNVKCIVGQMRSSSTVILMHFRRTAHASIDNFKDKMLIKSLFSYLTPGHTPGAGGHRVRVVKEVD